VVFSLIDGGREVLYILLPEHAGFAYRLKWNY
jgi:hypothetical protein